MLVNCHIKVKSELNNSIYRLDKTKVFALLHHFLFSISVDNVIFLALASGFYEKGSFLKIEFVARSSTYTQWNIKETNKSSKKKPFSVKETNNY